MRVSSVSMEEKEIRKLMADAELDIEADDIKEAGEKLGRAMQIAKNMGNEELVKQICGYGKKTAVINVFI